MLFTCYALAGMALSMAKAYIPNPSKIHLMYTKICLNQIEDITYTINDISLL